MDRTQRKARIEELLKAIGGLEESIRMSLENNDRDFTKILIPKKKQLYEKLRRVMYGLPEESPLEPKTED